MQRVAALVLASILSLAAAARLAALSPPPSADVARGSEEPFVVSGLQPRELRPGLPPLRWLAPRSRLRFTNLPAGPARLEVRLRGHRSAVAVAAGGVLLGRLEPGQSGLDVPLAEVGGTLAVDLIGDGFVAGDGRSLGAQLDRVTLVPARGWPGPGLSLCFALLAVLACGLALAAGVSAPLAGLAAALVTATQMALLWPSGLACSGEALSVTLRLAGAAAVGALLAAPFRRRAPGALFLGGLLAGALHLGVAPSRVMVVSDAVFHANKLGQVASGDLFPTSVTQHHPPFKIPYGVSFYAVLAPLARAGLDRVALVRWGAALALLAAGAALGLAVARQDPRRAGLALALLALLPACLDVPFSHGNLSNGFGQAAGVAFLAWWLRGGRSVPAGAALLALGGLAHLSSLIVVTAWSACLAFLERARLREDRSRFLALAVGLGLCALYYLHFAGLVAEQLPRLLEGSGGGPARSAGPLAALALQAGRAVEQWGLPALLLAAIGLAERPAGALRALLLAGGLLLLPAVVSPLEVRYLYALTPGVALLAAAGVLRLLRAGRAGAALAALALAAQATLAMHNAGQALFFRYR